MTAVPQTRVRCSACLDSGKTWEDDDAGSVQLPCHACCCPDCGRLSDRGDLCDECARMARGAVYDAREVLS